MDGSFLQNPLWAGNLFGQSFDDVTFLSGGVNEDSATVLLVLTPSGTEEMHGTLLDAATVPLTLTPSSADTYGHEDAATVALLLTPSGVDVEDYTEAATVYLTMTPLGGECYSRFHFTGEGEADPRWVPASDLTRWQDDGGLSRWYCFVEVQPGCN